MLQELNTFLDEHFPYCAGAFVPDPMDATPVVDCRSLLATAGFEETVTPFLARHRNVDKRAVLSVWSMYYFSHLAISPMVLWLVHRHAVSLAPPDLGLRLHGETRLPEAILLRATEPVRSVASIHDVFETLVFDHVAPLVGQFEKYGLSPRLVWSNLAVYVEWIARELGGRIHRDLGAEGLSLLECGLWPDGRPNPLHGLLGRWSPVDGGEFTRRRVCCLRYLLPDMPGCGTVCPLPAGRF